MNNLTILTIGLLIVAVAGYLAGSIEKYGFYGTRLGGWYFELLLWIDRRKGKKKYLTPKEVAQIIREHSLIGEGVLVVKRNIDKLLSSKTKEEYEKVLTEIEDMLPLGEDKDSSKAKLIQALRNPLISKIVDIETDTEKAKMIAQRIKDMKDLAAHREKRNLLREIRKLRQDKNEAKAKELEQEFYKKYGRQNR